MSTIHVFDDVLDQTDFATLAGVAASVHDSHREDSTVWFAHDRTARCFLEQVVEALRPWAPPGTSGGEWWFHMQPTTAALRLHFEKDDAMAREAGLFRQPQGSLILYLTDCGGPTIFTEQSYVSPVEVHPADPTRYALVSPRRNRLVRFDSRLYHGVLSDDLGSELRQSFLINWWQTSPAPPDCTSEIEGISSAFVPCRGGPIRARRAEPESVIFQAL